MTDPYRRYAGVYDRTGQDRFGAALVRVTLDVLSQQGFRPHTALDLATGTGAAAIALASDAIEVTGIDRSREMLREARRKAETLSLPIEWQTGSMESFASPRRLDLITCFYDCLNYLLEPELLERCFASVAGALVPGGWFVFDVNTIGRFERDWNRTTQVAYEDDDLLCLFRSTYDPETRISPLVLTVFERDETQRAVWRRWDEEHIERGYPLAELTALLTDACFSIEAIAAFNETVMEIQGPANDASERAIFFARYSPPDAKIPV
jgi:SAM-dependent methyltransferase